MHFIVETGRIPEALGALKNLVKLLLNGNQLNGETLNRDHYTSRACGGVCGCRRSVPLSLVTLAWVRALMGCRPPVAIFRNLPCLVPAENLRNVIRWGSSPGVVFA